MLPGQGKYVQEYTPNTYSLNDAGPSDLTNLARAPGVFNYGTEYCHLSTIPRIFLRYCISFTMIRKVYMLF